MILRIEQATSVKKNHYASNDFTKTITKSSQLQTTVSSTPIDSRLLQSYYVSFSARKASKKSEQQIFLERNYNTETKDLIKRATLIAQQYGHLEINELHIEKAALESIGEYINDLDTEVKTLNTASSYKLPFCLTGSITEEVYKDKKQRAKIKPVIQEELKLLDRKLAQVPRSKQSQSFAKGMILTENIVDKVFDIVRVMAQDNVGQVTPVDESMFMQALYDLSENNNQNDFKKFFMKVKEALMTDSRSADEKIHLSIYDEKAINVLKNLSLGTNMFITYDEKANPMYLIDSIEHIVNRPDSNFGTNTKLHVFNNNLQEDFFVDKIRELAKDKKTNHIIVFDQIKMLANSPKTINGTDIILRYNEDARSLIKNLPANIKMVIISGKDSYLANMGNAGFQTLFENFGEAPVPVLSTDQAKKAFREQPLLMSKMGIPFSRLAIDRTIEACASLDGTFPEKAQKIMKRMASYYVGHKEINESDVKKYIEQAKDLFKLAGDSSSVEIIFDTGIKVKDILGKPATKKEAESIVKQIKKGYLGTKGAIIYSQDGSVGSGRRYTAKSIAGETKSPYVEINALDFGTKDVDLFGDSLLSPENSIKKLFSLLRTQAEANPNKSAVLFVENFEYFSVGEFVSEYHQKAMSQLLREMTEASKKGLNILVLGSVSDPDAIGESTIKSFKFIDRIEVESPSRSIEARREILENFIAKRKLKLAGTKEPEKKALVKLMAETTEYFPFVYLVNLVDKMKTVAFERGHKQIGKEDIVEAYLQLTTGRPASHEISKPEKNVTTSHECGHGFNLEYMHDLAKKQNIPWHLGNKVNFITLDPRGVFGGAMYPKDGGNKEVSFEKIFSDLVCDYGGHSAEKQFYNIDGSWGITADIEMATRSAEQSVGIMGQGYHFGKKSLDGMNFKPSEKSLQVFEADRDAILDNARLVSDLITKFGTTFNKEFTEKYASFVGTGECLIHGDTFRAEIENWQSKQSKGKLAERDALDKVILNIIEAAKKGKKFNINGQNVSPLIKKLFKTVAYGIK